MHEHILYAARSLLPMSRGIELSVMTAHRSTARQLLPCPLSLIWMYANVLHLDLVLLMTLMVMPFLMVMIVEFGGKF